MKTINNAFLVIFKQILIRSISNKRTA